MNNVVQNPIAVRVRLAPSPTGALHIGTVRTALYNYLFAKKCKGTFVLRMEDTDVSRSERQFEKQIIDGLNLIRLIPDESPEKGGEYGPYRQSERTSMYRLYLDRLLQHGHAYKCFCTVEELEHERKQQQAQHLAPKYSGTCRNLSADEHAEKEKRGVPFTIRFKVPENRETVFSDVIRGEQHANTNDIGDFIIARSLNAPLFNFAVVIDDITMKITHVIRGEDHLPNMPKQILIYEALNERVPVFAHLPLILNPDRSKLSKRKNPVSLEHFLNEGYMPEAMINFLALLGWNPGTEQEIFSLDELIQLFSLERVHKSGAIFDIKKLNWVNGMHIRKSSAADLFEKLKKVPWNNWKKYSSRGDEYFLRIVAVLHDRLERLNQINELDEFFFTIPAYEPNMLIGKKMTSDQTRTNLQLALEALRSLGEFTRESAEAALNEVVAKQSMKKGEMLWPIRVALSGRTESPGTYELLWVLGRNESLERLEKAQKLLQPS